MNKLGIYLSRKSVNRSEVARRTGLSNPRLSELSSNPKARLTVEELCKIALAIGDDPCDLLRFICADIKLAANND
jgi:transcriptional regulator with XRE-family HTH domain